MRLIEAGLIGWSAPVMPRLVGAWRVEMTNYLAGGSRERPTTSTDLVCRRQWIAERHYLQDVTEGTFGGSPYYRQGLLGYSNMDQRYEWVTVDNAHSGMMVYFGRAGAGPRSPLVLTGIFTDQGWLGDKVAGKPVSMRTVITIENNDRHVLELYFKPPGGREKLVDRKVYMRMRR